MKTVVKLMDCFTALGGRCGQWSRVPLTPIVLSVACCVPQQLQTRTPQPGAAVSHNQISCPALHCPGHRNPHHPRTHIFLYIASFF